MTRAGRQSQRSPSTTSLTWLEKVVIVTGGNAGVGRVTVYALLRKNAKVYMASRKKSRAEPAIAELKEKTGKEAIFLQSDLASLRRSKGQRKSFRGTYIRLTTLDLATLSLMLSKPRVSASYFVQ